VGQPRARAAASGRLSSRSGSEVPGEDSFWRIGVRDGAYLANGSASDSSPSNLGFVWKSDGLGIMAFQI
jgi:hypothetical protein